MNIPDKIKIGGYIVEVKEQEHLTLERANQGEYHPMTQEIFIDPAMTEQQKQETFIHEVLEAITSIYDIDIEHKDLSNIATVLHQVIKDNPGIFIVEKEREPIQNITVNMPKVTEKVDIHKMIEVMEQMKQVVNREV